MAKHKPIFDTDQKPEHVSERLWNKYKNYAQFSDEISDFDSWLNNEGMIR
jgi:hypothetical protein